MRFNIVAKITFFLTFIGLFIYYYKTSGRFRKSISYALIAAFGLLSTLKPSQAKEVYGFTPKSQSQSRLIKRNGLFGSESTNTGPKKPEKPDSNGNDFGGIPDYKPPESVEKTEERLTRMDEYIGQLNDQSDSESELNDLSESDSESELNDGSELSSLTKQERRNLPDERDGVIDVEGRPTLIARYGQVKYKTPKHGGIHGLPTNENGKTTKTEANALAYRDSLIATANKPNLNWYEGMYQGGTPRGCDSVNLFDKDTKIVDIYKKQPDGSYFFLTSCKATPVEETHLYKSNGNFVTEAVLNDQKD